jgi:hypothetical protein
MHDVVAAGGLSCMWAERHVHTMSGSPYTVNYSGRVIGHVLFGLPAANGHRIGTLVPTRDYVEVRAPLRRWVMQSIEANADI